MSSTTNDAARQSNNLPSGVVAVTLVTDSLVCVALRSRIDSIASVGDANYHSQDLSRPILVFSAGSALVAGDPLHPQKHRQIQYHVFSSTGSYVSKFFVHP